MSWFKNLFGKNKKKKSKAASIARDSQGRWIYEVPSATKDLRPRAIVIDKETKSKACGCVSGKVCPCEKKKAATPEIKIKPVVAKKAPAKKPVEKKTTTTKPVAKKTSTPKKK